MLNIKPLNCVILRCYFAEDAKEICLNGCRPCSSIFQNQITLLFGELLDYPAGYSDYQWMRL